ncbi:3-oxoacyl-[acyl-carrier-protein] synthase 3 [Streptomyces spiroverticillatus]|uniref:3-oxoacyl-[acyl-carrier-protein] synthase 3 n=1 Tax=Streptomyces finlayi TaxID=67296 RepID=A0A918X015_9ACTN|nr:ketoacyl-ACP synthase III [Streptomyces finlayi]GHA17932.1 3-oxoacyl-[acyl-carrier-protein] synthase 3 [Streptomyces spiroverticillatus]GHC99666.1 3-oxoacyl-[acyl-carrier-protein] synthase 3 [Streptomyces finlayi]
MSAPHMTAPHTAWGILGLGVHVPERRVSNADIAEQYGVEPAWIERMTGITHRHYADPAEATSDLALAAAADALADAGLAAGDIDVVLLATSTPDQLAVATACRVQHRLGAHRAWATDIGGACAGFLNALKLARDVLTASYPQGRALVIGAETFSKFQNPRDRSTGVLFADGAGAVVVGPAGEGEGLLCSVQGSDGALADIVGIRAGGSARPADARSLAEGGHYLHMNGKAVAAYFHDVFPRIVQDLTRTCGLPLDRIDLVVPHQANPRMLRTLGTELGISPEQLVITADTYGNTGAASIPMALHTARADGRLAPRTTVLHAAVGAGMSWAGVVQRWL